MIRKALQSLENTVTSGRLRNRVFGALKYVYIRALYVTLSEIAHHRIGQGIRAAVTTDPGHPDRVGRTGGLL